MTSRDQREFRVLFSIRRAPETKPDSNRKSPPFIDRFPERERARIEFQEADPDRGRHRSGAGDVVHPRHAGHGSDHHHRRGTDHGVRLLNDRHVRRRPGGQAVEHQMHRAQREEEQLLLGERRHLHDGVFQQPLLTQGVCQAALHVLLRELHKVLGHQRRHERQKEIRTRCHLESEENH